LFSFFFILLLLIHFSSFPSFLFHFHSFIYSSFTLSFTHPLSFPFFLLSLSLSFTSWQATLRHRTLL
jgi:hypothetical protein